MDNLRPVLLITLAFLGYLMWLEWQKDYAPVTAPASQQTSESISGAGEVPGMETGTNSAADLPDLTQQAATPATPSEKAAPSMQAPSRVVLVRTDVLEVEIDLMGGTVVNAQLLEYPVDLEKPDEKVQLLHREGANPFIAQSGLLSAQSAPNHTSEYQSASLEYSLQDGSDEISVPLTWHSPDGTRVTKTFVFRRSGNVFSKNILTSASVFK